VGYAWLTSVVDPEEGAVLVSMVGAMAALIVAALCVPHAFDSSAGLFAGAQTLRQLLPREIDSPTLVRRAWRVAGGTIVDYPRFAYRGAMLDVARHFHTPDEIKSYVDEISRFKVNYLHLHLADDQGWRIQIDSWPRLAPVGGGPGTGVDGTGPGYLTKADYRDLVRYAAARYVTVGQCVRNAGTAAVPDMRITTCAGGTFKVLKRVEGRTTGEGDAESKCSKVQNYTKWYFYDSELDSLDFVLCLRERN
jgi:hypothetical protein